METLLNEVEAGKILGWTVKALQAHRWKRLPPRYVKVGRNVRYRVEDIEEFLAANTVEPRNNEEAVR